MEPPAQEPLAVDVSALQDEIATLAGIRAARVVTSGSGRVSEIHVVGEGNKSAKQIVRDIQTLALARFGLRIDYRIVSVVQLGDQAVPQQADLASLASRPALSSVSWIAEGSHTTCRVELASGEDRATGEASGASTSFGRLRLAAQAATHALRTSDGQAFLDVADVTIIEIGGRPVAVAVLVLLDGRHEEVLVGAALVRGEETHAVARAVLDAVNRRLPRFRV